MEGPDIVCVHQANFLEKEEALRLRDQMAKAISLHGFQGTVGSRDGNYSVDQSYRNSTIYFLDPWNPPDCMDGDLVRAVFYKIAGFAEIACRTTLEHLDIHLNDLASTPLQLGRYQVGERYEEHSDNSGKSKGRLLSVSVNVSTAREGGHLSLSRLPPTSPAVEEIRQDRAIVAFPSWERHSVSAVEHGERYSIVAWFKGTRGSPGSGEGHGPDAEGGGRQAGGNGRGHRQRPA